MNNTPQGRDGQNDSWYIWGYLLLGSLGAGFILWEVVLPILKSVEPIAALHNEVVLPFVLRAIYAQTYFTLAFAVLSAFALFLWPHKFVPRLFAVLVTLAFSYWLLHCSMWYYAYIPSMFIAVFILYSVMRYLWVFLFRASKLHAVVVAVAVAIVAYWLSGFSYLCVVALCIPFAALFIRGGSYHAIRRLVQSNNSRGVRLFYDALRYFYFPPLVLKDAGLSRFWNRSPAINLQGQSIWERLFVPFARKYRKRCNNGVKLEGALLVPARLVAGRFAPQKLQFTWLEELLKAKEAKELASFFNQPSHLADRPDEQLRRMIAAAENYWEYQYFTPAQLRNDPAEVCQLALKYDRMARIGLAMKTRLINLGQDRNSRVELGRSLDREQQYLLDKASSLMKAAVTLPASEGILSKPVIETYLDITAAGQASSDNSSENLQAAFRKLDALRGNNDALTNDILQACYWRRLARGLDAGQMESILTALRELTNQFSDSSSEKDRFLHAFISGHIYYRQRIDIRHAPDLKVDLAGRSGNMFYLSDNSEINSIIRPETLLADEINGENHG